MNGAASGSVAVVYLARGADDDALAKFRRFCSTYKRYGAGLDHSLFVIFKGFVDRAAETEAAAVFEGIPYARIDADDDNFDIGAYRQAAEVITQDHVCFLNTNTELACEHWLYKLFVNFQAGRYGLVGATGSYESLSWMAYDFPRFPNVHLRSNVILLERRNVLRIFPRRVPGKLDAFYFESGQSGLTRRIFELGLPIAVVGADGRAYAPQWWPTSETFRLGRQLNLLAHDNATRHYEALPWPRKAKLVERTWGDLTNGGAGLLPSPVIPVQTNLGALYRSRGGRSN